LPAFKESANKLLRDIIARRKPSGLAYDYSRAHEAVEGAIPAEGFYLDLANLRQERGLQAGVANLGGNLVGTDVDEISQSFRAFSAVAAAGMTVETRQYNLAVPREVTRPTAQWLAELESIADSTQVLGQATAEPKRVGVSLSYTKELFGDTAENFCLETGLKSIAEAVDRAALIGSGLAEPHGIYNMAGVGTVTFSAAANFANMLSMVGSVSSQNTVDSNIRFIGHPLVRQKLMGVQKFSGSSTTLWDLDESICGKGAFVTTNIGSTSLCAGDFSTLRLVLFGAATVIADPFISKRSQKIELVINQRADLICPFPAAFCINSGSVTQ
jgi:HK97 family phage major capsid protein